MCSGIVTLCAIPLALFLRKPKAAAKEEDE
jgi:hypothetical protein